MVTFCRHFKYLGSCMSFNLRDDVDVDARILAATQSMGALNNVWSNPHLSRGSKYLLFKAIPLNLLLWGCETWTLRQTLLGKLEVFLHRSIRCILSISLSQVKEEHIRNDTVREMFYDILRVRNMIAARQLTFVGKKMRGDWNDPAKRMITACCSNTRLRGRPEFHNKDALVQNLKLLFEDTTEVHIDNRGTLRDWHAKVQKEKYWKGMVHQLTDPTAPKPTMPVMEGARRRSGISRTSANPSNAPPPPRPPPSPRQSRRNNESGEHRSFDPSQVGRTLFDSLHALGLGLGASQAEITLKFRTLSRIYHPDVHDPEKTGLSREEATEKFQMINNACSYLRKSN